MSIWWNHCCSWWRLSTNSSSHGKGFMGGHSFSNCSMVPYLAWHHCSASHTKHAIEQQPSTETICTVVAWTWPWQYCRHKYSIRPYLSTHKHCMCRPRCPYLVPIWHNPSYIDTSTILLLWQSPPCPSQQQCLRTEFTHSPPFPWDNTNIC